MDLCKHATPSEKQGNIICSLNLYGGSPHHGVCKHCKKYESSTTVTQAITNAAKSILNTTIRKKNRVTDKEFITRLSICEDCPGKHAVFKHGKVYTCGEMLKIAKDNKQKTCGCVLSLKARDANEECPFGYWKKIDQNETK